jgi:hypothetical protein
MGFSIGPSVIILFLSLNLEPNFSEWSKNGTNIFADSKLDKTKAMPSC